MSVQLDGGGGVSKVGEMPWLKKIKRAMNEKIQRRFGRSHTLIRRPLHWVQPLHDLLWGWPEAIGMG